MSNDFDTIDLTPMLSWRLWRSMSAADAQNPIIRRSSQPRRPRRAAPRPRRGLRWLAAAAILLGGLRYAFKPLGGLALALHGDAGFATLETDEGVRAADALSVSVQRLRLGAEASLANAGLSPFIDVAGRVDSGDGATGNGVEVAGGLRYRSPTLGLEVKGRMLAMHAVEGYTERGVRATLIVGPGSDAR